MNLQKLEMHLKLTHLYLETGNAEQKKDLNSHLKGFVPSKFSCSLTDIPFDVH